MSDTVTPVKHEQVKSSTTENHDGIENHKKAAHHHEEAAKHHHEAAKHHIAGNHEKAAHCSVKAHGHHAMATEHQSEDAKLHAIKG